MRHAAEQNEWAKPRARLCVFRWFILQLWKNFVLTPLRAPVVSSLPFHVADELTVLYQHPGLMHDKEAQAAKPIEDPHSD